MKVAYATTTPTPLRIALGFMFVFLSVQLYFIKCSNFIGFIEVFYFLIYFLFDFVYFA